MKSPIQLFAAIAILLATATVAAQVYKWVDKDGKVQYSDSPPPASATKTEAKKVDIGPAVSGNSNAPAAAPSLADRNKDFEKRQKEAADKNKKAEEAAKNAAIEEENCKSAKAALRDFESERPLRRSSESGESVIISDEERQASLARAKAAVASSCKS